MTTLTRSLFAGAIAMTIADGIVYLLLIVPGRVAESNPLIVGLAPGSATGVKLLELLFVIAMATVLIGLRRHRLAAAVLSVAIVGGLLGLVSTIAAGLA